MTRRKRVGLLQFPGGAFNNAVTRGIAEFARAQGPWDLLVDIGGELSLDTISKGDVDGLITVGDQLPAAVQQLTQTGLPVVYLTSSGRIASQVQVSLDDVAVGRLVAKHFLELRHTNFLFAGFPQSWGVPWVQDRLVGYQEVLTAAGMSVTQYRGDESLNWTNFASPRYIGLLSDWIAAQTFPAAIFAVNDGRARQVIHACGNVGIQVPEQVAVVGVDNSRPLCEMLEPSLSSVPRDERRAGYEAAALLAMMMDGQPVPRQRTLIPPLPLEVRRSSDTMAFDDPDVAEALRFIWAHGDEPTSVQAVADAVAMSRRALELRFRQRIGRSISSEIWRVHVEYAKRLLRETNLPMATVAARSGFVNVGHFCVRFRQGTATTPTQFRALHKGS